MQRLLEGEANMRDVEDVLLSSLSSYLLHGPSSTGAVDGNGDGDENGGNASPVLTPFMIDGIESVIFDISSISDGVGDSRFLHMLISHPVDYVNTDIDRVDDRDASNHDDRICDVDFSAMPMEMRDALSILDGIERLLPNPEIDEESHRSAWDVIIDLHGRESVRIMEERLRAEIAIANDECDRIRTSDGDGDDDVVGLGLLMNIRSRDCLQWRTLCSIGRVLIHYDFLTRGVLKEGAFRRW
jgi:hypothetical protein